MQTIRNRSVRFILSLFINFQFLPFSKEVLSFALCPPSKLYGVGGTVVVAGKAGEAFAVVQPLGARALVAFDVLHRADLGTLATLDASV